MERLNGMGNDYSPLPGAVETSAKIMWPELAEG